MWFLFAIGACEKSVETPTTEPAPAVARCGDGVIAGDEACDDGNAFGGDGCLPDCAAEPAPLEAEPNDAWDAAEPWTEAVHAGLPEGDVDCFSFDVPACDAIAVGLDCSGDGMLTLHDPSGVVVATGTEGPDGCPVIDPAEAPGAQFAAGGTYAVCVSSLTGAAIPAYTLHVAHAPGSFPVRGDLDDDGVPDECDADDDGDGLADDVDNCPAASNGPDTEPLTVRDDGFLRDWLAIGPITGTVSPDVCLPSTDTLAGGDDAALAPEIGDPAGDLTWGAHLSTGAIFFFLADFGFVDAPREVYTHVYVSSPVARDVTLAVGADDGVRAWLDGEVLLDIPGCQGVNLDQFQAPAHLDAGVNRLTLKVRDQGGGWGQSVRFFDAADAPVTDLSISLSADPTWIPDQTDSDGDGVGDVCDPD